MRRIRVSWAVVGIAALAGLLVPSLREQWRGGQVSTYYLRSVFLLIPNTGRHDPAVPLRYRAIDFVEQRCANDPGMLMAAGLLAANEELGQSRLWRAAQMRSSPVYWAAYLDRLIQTAPAWERPTVDPADAKQMADERTRLATSNRPDRLPPEVGAVTLQALHEWEKVEPDNGLPWAYEFLYLYGLHRDAEAAHAWQEAGRRPGMRAHHGEMIQASAELLTRMGMPAADARLYTVSGAVYPGYARLGQAATYAAYEGRRAQLAGDAAGAVRWWHATINVGRHLQDSPETLIGYLVGQGIESTGAGYAWRWREDPGPKREGPLLGGRLYYGPAHSFYAAQVGAAADAEVRDRLAQGKVRTRLLRRGLGDDPFAETSPLMRAAKLIWVGRAGLFLGGWLLAAFVLASLMARKEADAAARLGPIAKTALVVLTPVPAVASVLAMLALMSSQNRGTIPPWMAPSLSTSGLLISLLIGLGGPLLLAARRHAPEVSTTTAWRGHLRRVLPPALACCALLFIGAGAPAAKLRADWLRTWGKSISFELTNRIRPVQSEWDHPQIPRGAWVAAFPPPQSAPPPSGPGSGADRWREGRFAPRFPSRRGPGHTSPGGSPARSSAGPNPRRPFVHGRGAALHWGDGEPRR